MNHLAKSLKASSFIAGICSLLILSALFFPVSAYGGSQSKTVKIGYYEQEIFQEGAGDGEYKSGYAYEYYRKISEYTGWKLEYVYGDYTDLYDKLVEGKIDLLAGLAYKPEREQYMSYPDAVMGSEAYYLIKHETDQSITADPTSMNGKTFGVLESNLYTALNKYLSDNNISASVRVFDDYTALFREFDDGSIDVLAAESDGASSSKDSIVLLSFGSSDYYMCVNRERPDLLDDLNTAQSQLATEEPNFISGLRAKYYPASVTSMAFSDAEILWLNNHSRLRVGYLDNYLPYSGTNGTGDVTGIVKDLVPEMLNKLNISGIKISYRSYDSHRELINAINRGDLDLIFPVGGGLYYSEENGIYQSGPVASISSEIAYKDDFSNDTTSVFAINRNNKMQYYNIKSNYPDSKIIKYSSIDECLDAVLSGKATCTLLDGLRANEILKNRKYRNLSLHQTGITDVNCFGIKLGNEGLLKLVNRGISVCGSDYAINDSYKYSSALYSSGPIDVILDNLPLFTVIFLLFASFAIILLLRDSKRKKQALQAAESANRAKTTFLFNMSHDIRTPLNAIIGFTELEDKNINDREKVLDYHKKVNMASHQLLDILNNVLAMARIENHKITIEEELTDAEEFFDIWTGLFDSERDKKNLTLKTSCQIVHKKLYLDKTHLSEILMNVVSNAVKYTPDGGEIFCGIKEFPGEKDGECIIETTIADNGIGMSDDFAAHIFDQFARERNSSQSGIQGTGLGMAIVKGLIDAMKGSVEVKSQIGEGTRVTIRIPHRYGEDSSYEKNAKALNTDYFFAGKRILLAEDVEFNALLATEILEMHGFEVEIAKDGVECVDMLNKSEGSYYDLILMDIQMPNMNGYDATKLIRNMKDPAKSNIPIFAMTANAFDEDRHRAIESGMNGHIAKPLEMEKMLETIASVIQ